MKFRLPIAVTISVLAFILLLVQGGIISYVSYQTVVKDIVDESKAYLISEAISSEGALSYLYRRNELEQLQEEITAKGANKHIRQVFFLDDNNKIIASNRIEYIGDDISSLQNKILGHPFERDFSLVKKTLRYHLDMFDDNTMAVLQPVNLGSSRGSFRPDKIGVLLLTYDLDWIHQQGYRDLLEIIKPLMLFMVATTILFGVLVYYLFIKRIHRLSEAVNVVKDGLYSHRVNDRASDEIGLLGRFFNQMMESIESHRAVLLESYEEISEREQNLTLTLQSIGDAVIVTDARGVINRINPIACGLTGWAEYEAMGMPLSKVFKIINSSTRELVLNPVQKVIETGKVVGLANHTALIDRYGNEFQIADSAAPIINDSGTIIGVIMVFQDVTAEYAMQKALKDSEQRLSLVMEATDEGVWDWNVLTGEVYYSPRWEALLGYAEDEIEPHISSWENLIHGDDHDKVMSVLNEHLESRTDFFEIEHRLRKKDGSWLWVMGRGKVVDRDKQGAPRRALGVAVDISIQKINEDKIRQNQKLNAIGKLTGGIAHDYNNLLGVIIGYAELLQSKVADDAELNKYVATILHAGERGAKLTRRLLAFSRSKEIEAVAVDINQVLKEEEHLLSKSLTARIQLDYQFDENLWLVFLDKSDLEDTILNMSINAMHAMHDGGVLTIETHNMTLTLTYDEAKQLGLEPGDYVCMSVTDTGIGMDEVTIEKVFEPFYSTKGDKGTGLGLSQVYGFVQRSDGEIRIQSELGVGSKFLLYFPRYRQANDVSTDEGQPRSVSANGKEVILVVDDESDLRTLAREMLSEQGYAVVEADSGEQALEILSQQTVDVMISDVIMPGMDGYQLAQRVSQQYPHIKIQMVSGYTGNRGGSTADLDLENNLLKKPFSSMEMLQRIRQLLDSVSN